ncbi:murein hydrolase activator NlpD [Vibrio paucivorans]|uniref:Murein hydrolase activator NlpD n=1 Tax=Vibrio paucivorans TaxID=2829489 RepID=A0A9X3CDK9_9VIBR|nr:murein hydrolase activator NlpD [Vibrio paucivorans]MCW8333738.1 murein hydrolase activator NlpD [Vibrio paucivorans]
MKVVIRSILVLVFFSVLIGCAASTPAPVSNVTKGASGLKKDYNSVSRGSYRGSYYEVQKGDTLYFISYVTDRDVKEIIRYNNLSAPYTIRPGQKLMLWRPAYVAPNFGGTGAGEAPAAVAATTTPPPSKSATQTTASKKTPPPQTVAKKDPPKKVDQSKSKEYVKSTSKQNVNKSTSSSAASNTKVTKWLWPTKGRVIKNFSAGDQGNKGIDIAGQRGQSIISTAGGTVVYSGNALRGYGNLVIVKHNDNYLSAYAHNDRLLVHEGQSVKAGQKIATMGSSGTNSVRLHFEIRYQGKSVNPKRYLP